MHIYDLNAYPRTYTSLVYLIKKTTKKTFVTVLYFKIRKEAYSVLKIKHQQIGQLYSTLSYEHDLLSWDCVSLLELLHCDKQKGGSKCEGLILIRI